jgi:hypothetical protein
MRLAKVLSLSDPSAHISKGDSSQDKALTRYVDLNSLKKFLCAFPSSNTVSPEGGLFREEEGWVIEWVHGFEYLITVDR